MTALQPEVRLVHSPYSFNGMKAILEIPNGPFPQRWTSGIGECPQDQPSGFVDMDAGAFPMDHPIISFFTEHPASPPPQQQAPTLVTSPLSIMTTLSSCCETTIRTHNPSGIHLAPPPPLFGAFQVPTISSDEGSPAHTPTMLTPMTLSPSATVEQDLCQFMMLEQSSVAVPNSPFAPLPSGWEQCVCTRGKSWKRLRLKNGVKYYLCRTCGAKWKVFRNQN